MPIRILSISVSSQITAGEIIERPAPVVKELLKNSIDAQSKNINIKQNGFKSITIKDDGFGIYKDELLPVISSHVTSKMSFVFDLTTINTFGFRGELLSSIRSVLRITLISCYKYNNIGWKIYSEEFNQKTILNPIVHPVGTTTIVENLFYNIPIHLKFFKNKNSDFLKMYDVIKFDEKIFRLNQIFEKLDVNSLLIVKKDIFDIKFFQRIARPLYFLNSLKNIQYCYINNQFIFSGIANKAIINAYYKLIGVNINRSFILYVYIPIYEIDINIHLTKSQVRFNKPNKIYSLIYNFIASIVTKNQMKLCIYNFLLQNNDGYFIKNIDMFYFQLIIKKFLEKQKNIFLKSMINNNLINVYSRKFLKNQFFCSLKLLIIIKKYYSLIYYFNDFILISFPVARKIIDQYKLKYYIKNNIIPESYIVNFQIIINPIQYKILFNNQSILYKFGFPFILSEKYINFNKIPCILKINNLNLLMLDFLLFLKNILNIKKF